MCSVFTCLGDSKFLGGTAYFLSASELELFSRKGLGIIVRIRHMNFGSTAY